MSTRVGRFSWASRRKSAVDRLAGAALLAGGVFAVVGLASGAESTAGPAQAASGAAAAAPRLQARTARSFAVPDADQGVAVDRQSFYAVDNAVIAKHDLADGRQVARWTDPTGGLIRHLNSCLADAGRLWCANSNYPQRPMGSSIEVFDAAALRHVESHALGLLDEGSITWFDRVEGGWIAGFAHYTGNGGVPYKDHTYSSVVAFDGEWRRRGGWLFPPALVERMSPDAASGGAIGPDGWLYLTGHDRPELYVVGRPTMGPALVHVATIDVEAEGQAFSWAQDGSRMLYAIDRRTHRVLVIDVLPIAAAPAVARRFR
jgi:hypothetical protein